MEGREGGKKWRKVWKKGRRKVDGKGGREEEKKEEGRKNERKKRKEVVMLVINKVVMYNFGKLR